MTKKQDGFADATTQILADESLAMRKGGDFHQYTSQAKKTLTTQSGTPIADDHNTLKVHPRGPALMEDFIFRDKLFHFDHERIPERVVHARGFGAHGFFETYGSLSHLTKAHIFQKKNTKTPAFVRFSTVAGNKGSADLARDVRGFAVKLYTQEGNWDLVGNNIPVFFIQDPMKFPDLIHAAKDEPDRGFPQAQTAHDNFWDFITLSPETMHMVMWIMSDRTIPRSFRFMEGFGVHTFRLVNAKGQSSFVKFHWKPKLGLQSVTWDEALTINGADPDYHRRDLWNAIQSGDFPEWELGLQIFDDKFADAFPFDVLDATKLIPEEEVPITIVGRLVLNRCVDNFFAETEQVAFCTQNIVPGIDFTNDPLLQGRNFSYLDTQLKRLGGPNFNHLPINAPKCPFANFQQDGHMAFHNPQGRANYNPNSWHLGPRENPETGFQSFVEDMKGQKLRARPDKFADHYSQARQFYISQTPIEQQHLTDALVFELSKVETPAIRVRMVAHLLNIDKTLAKKVANGLGLANLPQPCDTAKAVKKLVPSDKLSILKNPPMSVMGRRFGIVLAGNISSTVVNDAIKAIKKEKATHTIIAPHITEFVLGKAHKMAVNEQIGGAPAAFFDAIVMIFDPKALAKDQHFKIKEFVTDAYMQNKYIAFTSESTDFMETVLPELDKGCFDISKKEGLKGFIQACQSLRFWERR